MRIFFLFFFTVVFSSIASTPNEDFIVDMAREEFKLAGPVTEDDLKSDYKCVNLTSLNGALPEYNNWKISLPLSKRMGDRGFTKFTLSDGRLFSEAVDVSDDITGLERVYGRRIEKGRLVFEHTVQPSRYYRGVASIADANQVAYAYWICFSSSN